MLQQGAFKLLQVNFMQWQIGNNFFYINGQAYRKVLTYLWGAVEDGFVVIRNIGAVVSWVLLLKSHEPLLTLDRKQGQNLENKSMT